MRTVNILFGIFLLIVAPTLLVWAVFVKPHSWVPGIVMVLTLAALLVARKYAMKRVGQ